MSNGHGGGALTDLPGELKRWADAIKASAEAIDTVAETLESHATRSVILEVNNTTSRTLTLHGSGDHDWGGFRQLPPDPIAPRATGLFTSQSDGLLTGTQGHVQYRLDGDGTLFHLEWNNPFVGDNESLCRVEGEHADFYATAAVTGGGNTKAHMRFMVGEKADASPRQRDWRTCQHCKLLIFELEEGHCAARPLGIASAPSDEGIGAIVSPSDPGPSGIEVTGPGRFGDLILDRPPEPAPAPATAGTELFGRHEAAGGVFRLAYGVPGPNREGGWRKCSSCRGLFYDGFQANGACPGRRGGHVAADEGYDFQLMYETPPSPSQQDNWRFCDKCYGLFFFPQNAEGVCPAGDQHRAYTGHPDNYVLDRI